MIKSWCHVQSLLLAPGLRIVGATAGEAPTKIKKRRDIIVVTILSGGPHIWATILVHIKTKNCCSLKVGFMFFQFPLPRKEGEVIHLQLALYDLWIPIHNTALLILIVLDPGLEISRPYFTWNRIIISSLLIQCQLSGSGRKQGFAWLCWWWTGSPLIRPCTHWDTLQWLPALQPGL